MDDLTPKPKNPEAALATQPKTTAVTKPRTRKRSRVQLDATATAETIKPTNVAAAPGSAQGVALSAVDAFKTATVNEYTNAMGEAVPELFDFFEEVNAQIGDFMINQINQAYGVEPTTETTEITEVA